MRALAATVLAGGSAMVASAGCESTQETSARLAKASTGAIKQTKVTIGRPNRDVHVTATTVLRDANGTAVVVELRNRGAVQADVPVALTLRGKGGAVVYRNDDGGLDASLVGMPALDAGGRHAWVDDQIQASATPRSATVRLGAARGRVRVLPEVAVTSVRLGSDSSGAMIHGKVVNRSPVPQKRIVVYAVGRRGGRIVAAGRAVVDALGASATARFAVYPIGDPRGATLTLWAPPTTFGDDR